MRYSLSVVRVFLYTHNHTNKYKKIYGSLIYIYVCIRVLSTRYPREGRFLIKCDIVSTDYCRVFILMSARQGFMRTGSRGCYRVGRLENISSIKPLIYIYSINIIKYLYNYSRIASFGTQKKIKTSMIIYTSLKIPIYLQLVQLLISIVT